ncbi:22.0 kDa heat shock protein-like [Silene latifolia]|uniref:22.0 kDa heat shock protein-like n=1 Tax=Silene latifolia TaxID=37657 RepID=UPI003D76B42E
MGKAKVMSVAVVLVIMSMILNPSDGKQIVERSKICCEKGGDGVEMVKADVTESMLEYSIIVQVPGINDLTVEIKNKDYEVFVRGERVKPNPNEFGQKTVCCYSEISYGQFWRCFRFPVRAEMDRVKFRLDNGLLHISAPLRVPE